VRRAHPALPTDARRYSDSDPEEHAKKEKERPVWTHSPQIRAALQAQSTVNPDSIFGAIPQLSLPGASKPRRDAY